MGDNNNSNSNNTRTTPGKAKLSQKYFSKKGQINEIRLQTCRTWPKGEEGGRERERDSQEQNVARKRQAGVEGFGGSGVGMWMWFADCRRHVNYALNILRFPRVSGQERKREVWGVREVWQREGGGGGLVNGSGSSDKPQQPGVSFVGLKLRIQKTWLDSNLLCPQTRLSLYLSSPFSSCTYAPSPSLTSSPSPFYFTFTSPIFFLVLPFSLQTIESHKKHNRLLGNEAL